MTNLINLTPHPLNIFNSNNTVTVIPPTGKVARVSSSSTVVDNISGIDIYALSFGEVTDLPEPAPDTVYIVSRMVKDRVPSRKDVLVPGNPVRDGSGNIVGSNGLCL